MKCNICGSHNLTEIYNSTIRNGSFGNITDENRIVFKCNECAVCFLSPNRTKISYDTPEYRKKYNDISDINEVEDPNLVEKISNLPISSLKGKVVADYGAANGNFIDIAKSVASKTIAIEPSKAAQQVLSKKHQVYGMSDALKKDGVAIDIATAFDVIEHVDDPMLFIGDIYDSLVDNGRLVLTTPNYFDVNRRFHQVTYDQFDFRTAHLYYFSEHSIMYLLRKKGFTHVNVKFVHRYDLSNLLYWMKDSKPTGIGYDNFFDEGFDLIYRNYVQEKGASSHLWVEAIK